MWWLIVVGAVLLAVIVALIVLGVRVLAEVSRTMDDESDPQSSQERSNSKIVLR